MYIQYPGHVNIHAEMLNNTCYGFIYYKILSNAISKAYFSVVLTHPLFS